jgi:hypothetical protein
MTARPDVISYILEDENVYYVNDIKTPYKTNIKQTIYSLKCGSCEYGKS